MAPQSTSILDIIINRLPYKITLTEGHARRFIRIYNIEVI